MLDTRVEVLWAQHYRYWPGWELRPHRHRPFQLSQIVSDEAQFILGDRTYWVHGPLLFLVGPYEMHGLNAIKRTDMFDVKFRVCDPEFRKKLLAATPVCHLAAPDILAMFERIRVEGEGKRAFYREMCGLYASQILLHFLQRQQKVTTFFPHSSDVVPDTLLARALEVIAKRYRSALSVSDISNCVGCSERTLRRRAQTVLEIGPAELLRRYRIERAKEFMEGSNLALKQVAVATGFKNVFHFTRIFTEVEGVPPGVWRRKYLEGIGKEVRIDTHFIDQSWSVVPKPHRKHARNAFCRQQRGK